MRCAFTSAMAAATAPRSSWLGGGATGSASTAAGRGGATAGAPFELARRSSRNGGPSMSSGADLHEATGVRARVGLRSRRQDGRRLAVTQLARRLGPDEVVDPRASAAEVLPGGLAHLEPRYAREHGSRRRPDALRVREMARVL